MQLPGWKPAEREPLASAMLPLVGPTLSFDRDGDATPPATRPRAPSSPRSSSSSATRPSRARATPSRRRCSAQFAAMRVYSHTERRPQHFIGLFLFACALYWGAWRFTEYRSHDHDAPALGARAPSRSSASPCSSSSALMRVGFVARRVNRLAVHTRADERRQPLELRHPLRRRRAARRDARGHAARAHHRPS